MPYISDEDLKLLQFAGFKDRFESEIKNFPTYQAAFEEINNLHQRLFGFPRYSDYDSFRSVYQRHRRQKT